MGRLEKLMDKLRRSENTFAWNDVLALFSQLGYIKVEGAGSRVTFINKDQVMIKMHKPHPENYIKGGALKAVKQHLSTQGIYK